MSKVLVYDPGQDDDGSAWDGAVANLLGDGLEPADDTPDYVDADGLHYYSLIPVEQETAVA